jgi:hypothetical protein
MTSPYRWQNVGPWVTVGRQARVAACPLSASTDRRSPTSATRRNAPASAHPGIGTLPSTAPPASGSSRPAGGLAPTAELGRALGDLAEPGGAVPPNDQARGEGTAGPGMLMFRWKTLPGS